MLNRVLSAVMIVGVPVGLYCNAESIRLALATHDTHLLFQASILILLLAYLTARFVGDMLAAPCPAPCEAQQPRRRRSVVRRLAAKKGIGK